VTLEVAAHDLPPVVSLRRLHIHKLNAHSPFAAMADYGTHLQLSSRTIVVNAEMNFNFCACGILDLTQDAYANRAHVRQKARHKLAGWAKQNTPIGGASGAGPPFGRWIVGQFR
jgi:hypothetical protein